MRFNLVFNPEFFNDLEQAMDWYEARQTGLGKDFYLLVREQTSGLKTTAFNYAIRYDVIRCLSMKKFPYMIHFRIDEENKLVKIEALFHTSRNQNIWTKRK